MFTADNTLNEVAAEPGLKKYLPFLVCGHDLLGASGHKKVRALWGEAAGQAIVNALKRVCDNEDRQNCLYPVYPAENEEKAHVSIVDFPCDGFRSARPWILLCAGGSYVNVWNITEAWPTAVYFNRLGYHVFTLNYTVGGTGLLPEPLKDVAAAIEYIRRHADAFGIQPEEYVIGGFSAGGHLAACWATEEHGCAKYGIAAPRAALLIYAASSTDYLEPELQKSFRITMAGTDASPETLARWNAENVMTAAYPPTYVIHSEDDGLVGVKTARVMEKRLKELHVPHVVEIVRKSGHGFADGAGTDAVDWPVRADAFIRKTCG